MGFPSVQWHADCLAAHGSTHAYGILHIKIKTLQCKAKWKIKLNYDIVLCHAVTIKVQQKLTVMQSTFWKLSSDVKYYTKIKTWLNHSHCEKMVQYSYNKLLQKDTNSWYSEINYSHLYCITFAMLIIICD